MIVWSGLKNVEPIIFRLDDIVSLGGWPAMKLVQLSSLGLSLCWSEARRNYAVAHRLASEVVDGNNLHDIFLVGISNRAFSRFARLKTKRGKPRRRPSRPRSEKLDVLGDNLAAVAIIAFGILSARIVQPAGYGELIAPGLVFGERGSCAIEDCHLIKLGSGLRVAPLGIFLNFAIADDRAFGDEDRLGDPGAAAGALHEPRREGWDTARRARENSKRRVGADSLAQLSNTARIFAGSPQARPEGHAHFKRRTCVRLGN